MKYLRGFLVLLCSLIILSFSAYATCTGFSGLGSGTSSDPYNISNCYQLQNLSQNADCLGSANYYRLVNNIGCSMTNTWDSGNGFKPIGNVTHNFQANFNGAGFYISGLYINRASTDYIGLFGILSSSSNVNNLGLININFTGYTFTGGIVGYLEGLINNSYTTGYVSSTISSSNNAYAGGIAGISNGGLINNSHTGVDVSALGNRVGGLTGYIGKPISNSYATGKVSGNGAVGGLIGFSNAPTASSNLYSTGNVSGTSSVGGLIGQLNQGSITYSYSTGLVTGSGSNIGGLVGVGSGCSNSFWDNQTSNRTTSACGTPKTTNQMKNSTTFIISGWDFSAKWGKSSIVNNGYPYLKWAAPSASYAQYTGTDFNNLADRSNVSNANISKSGSTIRWNGDINAAGADFDSYATLGPGFVSIDVSQFDSTINTSAVVTFSTTYCNDLVVYHASSYYTTLYEIQANGVDCTTDGSCSNVQCNGNTVTFTANNFDGFGGSGAPVPEFSTITVIIAMAIVLSGILTIRRKN